MCKCDSFICVTSAIVIVFVGICLRCLLMAAWMRLINAENGENWPAERHEMVHAKNLCILLLLLLVLLFLKRANRA